MKLLPIHSATCGTTVAPRAGAWIETKPCLTTALGVTCRSPRGGVRIVRGLGLRSLRLGVVGKADVVELERVGSQESGVGRGEKIALASEGRDGVGRS